MDPDDSSPSDENSESTPIRDLRAAMVDGKDRRRTWHALTQHGATWVLLCTLCVTAPLLLVLLGLWAPWQGVDALVSELLKIWLGAVITLAGGAAAFYFRGPQEPSDAQ